MGLILLEAAGALAILIFIVWWTMFSGRKGGERPTEPGDAAVEQAPVAPEQVVAPAPSASPRQP